MINPSYLINDILYKNIVFKKPLFKFLFISKVFYTSFKEILTSYIFNFYLMFFMLTARYCFIKTIVFKSNLATFSRKKKNKNVIIYFYCFLVFNSLNAINISYIFSNILTSNYNNKFFLFNKSFISVSQNHILMKMFNLYTIPFYNSLIFNNIDVKILNTRYKNFDAECDIYLITKKTPFPIYL
jgi:hypothetical protein